MHSHESGGAGSRVYLDHNATSPLRAGARAAIEVAWTHAWANPGSAHRDGQAAASALERARGELAHVLGVSSKDVHFTSGATEANAWVLRGLPTPDRPRVLCSAVEHPSVRVWATDLVPVDGQGRVRVDALEALLSSVSDEVAVVSVMGANNETGVVQPISEVLACCRAAGVPFHCDATQLPGKLPVPIEPDHVSLTAHKVGGPRGCGALVSRRPPPPLIEGGGQERGARAGTVAVPLVAGFAAAMKEPPMDVGHLRDELEHACRSMGGHVVGAGAPRLPNTLFVRFDVPGDLVVIGLDLLGISASTGSACSSGSPGSSAVLRAMGQSGIPVRFSLGPDTTQGQIQRASDALASVLARAREA